MVDEMNISATTPEAVTPEETPPQEGLPRDKTRQAKTRIAQAESTLKGVDAEIEACFQKVEADLAAFKRAEEILAAEGLRPARRLLNDLGVTDKQIQAVPVPRVDLEDPEVTPVEIRKISSGRLAGLGWGVLGGSVAIGGWCYAATRALGLPLLPDKLPDTERINALLGWTAQQLGQGTNVAVGGAIVVIGVLAVIGLIYWVVTALSASSNLKTAEKIEADTEFYCTKKSECKAQMKRVREHIAHAQKTVEKYTVLLAEQNASLKRALFVEEAEGFDQLHALTRQTVAKLQKLSDEIETFLRTPMAEHGILSKEGVAILERANKAANDHVMALYGE